MQYREIVFVIFGFNNENYINVNSFFQKYFYKLVSHNAREME